MKQNRTMKVVYGLLLLFLIVSCRSRSVEIYVAPDGNDVNSGDIKLPLKSISKAVELAAEMKERNGDEQVDILLREGVYYLDKTVRLSEQLSGLTIMSYGNEQVVVSAGRTLDLEWEKRSDSIYSARVAKGVTIEQLYVDGKKAIRARYPNYDKDVLIYNGYAADAVAPERVKGWSDPTTGVLHAIHAARWGGYHYEIAGVDSNGNVELKGGWQNNRQMGMHKEYRFVENIKEELDAPNEWFYDKKMGELIYYKGSDTLDLDKATIAISELKHVFEICGSKDDKVRDIVISGLDIRCTAPTYMLTKEPLLRSDWTIYRGGAILISDARDIAVENNRFTDLGGNGVFVSGNCMNVNVSSNRFDQIGASAIAFVGCADAVRSPSFEYHQYIDYVDLDLEKGPKSDNYPTKCLAFDNLISNIGLIEKQVAGVQISMAEEITVRHNTIYNTPRAGINISEGTWGGHLIEGNDVFNTVLETSDHGAFNSWGRDRFWHPKRGVMDRIVKSHPSTILLDAQKTTVIRNNRFRCDHGWDIDLDDGSSNYYIYNNVCLSGGIKLREGFYRKVENNVVINNTLHPHVWFKNSHDVIRYNMFASWYRPIRLMGWGDTIDYNFFPKEADLIKSQRKGLDGNGHFGKLDFVDAAKADYRVKRRGEAFKVGFKNFAMDRFGVVSDHLKKQAEKPEIPTLYLGSGDESSSRIVKFLGAKIRKVNGIAEVSAAGLKDDKCVMILDVAPKSVMWRAGLRAGDVILAIDNIKTTSIEEVLEVYSKEKWHGKLNVSYHRNQQRNELEMMLR